MRLFDGDGARLYLTTEERARFLRSADQSDRETRMFCHVLHYTGGRPSEIADLTSSRIHLDENVIVLRTLKRKKKQYGKDTLHNYRSIPVPGELVTNLDLVFDLLARQQSDKRINTPLWLCSRTHYWRKVKGVMVNAGIAGPQASAKGLRHGFAIAMLAGEKPVPINILRDLMGHTRTETTEIYLQAIGQEKRKLVMDAWSSVDTVTS